MNQIQESQVLEALQAVIDPDFGKNIVELGFVQSLQISPQGRVSFDLVLTTPACPIKDKFKAQCEQIVGALPGVTEVKVELKAQVPKRSPLSEGSLLANVRHIVGVASGKGGVGKSTVTANLAMGLALSGARVGILDADIYGPSMGMMFGVEDLPEVREDRTLVPVDMAGIQIVSMSMFSDPDKATIWRGPMATQMINNFLHRVHWGELDYLLIDFPPGTGDIQLTLTQSTPLSGAVVVTTPQNVALADVRKGLSMFRAVSVPVIGVVENMSWFACDNCQKKHYIFRQGGGQRTADELKLPFLGEIPLEPGVADSGDMGRPVVYTQPNSLSAQAMIEIAGKVAQQLEILSAGASHMGTFHLNLEDMVVASLPESEVLPDSIPSPSQVPVPTSLFRTPDNLLALQWSDGKTSAWDWATLRKKCPCASCVDEWTGKQLLDPASIPADIELQRVYSVGRYAIGLVFSDGHHSGIYSFEYLRRLNL